MRVALIVVLAALLAAPNLGYSAEVETAEGGAAPQEADPLDVAVSNIRKAVETNPAGLRQASALSVYTLLQQLSINPGRASQRDEVIEALYRVRWDPGPLGDGADPLWVELALKRLEQGKTAEAAEVAGWVKAPRSIIDMLIDKRFDPVARRPGQTFDPIAGAERQLAALQQYRAEHPESLAAVNAVAISLRRLGRYAQALTMLDQALADADPPGGGPSRFNDLSDRNWTLEYRASILRKLGRADEATTQLREASKRTERGRPNVSQRLNAAIQANSDKRPKEAIKLANSVKDNVSPYGLMVKHSALACAYGQLSDAKRSTLAFEYLETHRSDGPLLVYEATLCANDIERASGVARTLLADPKTRVAFLRRLQSFKPPGDEGAPESDPDDTNERRLMENRLLARPEVVEAIDAVGRVETFPIGS